VSKRLRFQRAKRLTHNREYQAAYAARLKKVVGPLLVWGCPGQHPHWRLGLSVGKRVGNAVARNRTKRIIREAFRQIQDDLPLIHGPPPQGGAPLPRGYDMVVSVRTDQPLELASCRQHLLDGARAIHKEWQKRAARQKAAPPPQTRGESTHGQ
jgi:ribonuclease P protein component